MFLELILIIINEISYSDRFHNSEIDDSVKVSSFQIEMFQNEGPIFIFFYSFSVYRIWYPTGYSIHGCIDTPVIIVGLEISGLYTRLDIRWRSVAEFYIRQIPDKKFDIRHETRYPTKNPARTGYIAELPTKYRISAFLVGYIIRFRKRLDGYPVLLLDLISNGGCWILHLTDTG